MSQSERAARGVGVKTHAAGRDVLWVLAATMLIAASGFVLWGLSIQPRMPPRVGVIEGRVADTTTVQAPIGPRLAYGRVRVTAVTSGSKGNRHKPLHVEDIGDPEIELVTSRGAIPVRLPPFDHATWHAPFVSFENLVDLGGTWLDGRVRGWREAERKHFSVTVWGVRPGQELIVMLAEDGRSVKRLWGSSRAALAEREHALVASHRRLVFGVAGAVGLLGIVLLAAQLALRRRWRLAEPTESGPKAIPAWVSSTLQESGARYEVTWQGRPLSVACSHRRHGPGSVQLRLGTPLATRMAWARRPALGAALDTAAGLSPEPGETLGYAGLELALAEREWAKPVLSDPRVQEAVATAFDQELHGSPAVVLSLRPGALVLSLAAPDHARLDAAACDQLLTALARLLDAAEQAPPPQEVLERSRIERMADDPAKVKRMTAFAVGIMSVVLVFATLAALALLR